MRRRGALLLALGALVAAAAGTAAWAALVKSSPRLTVLGAASLTDVLPRIDPAPRYSFAGSNALSTQVEQGAPADVFASANTRLPRELYAEGLVEKPVVFTANALVLVVPRGNPGRIHSVFDLRRDGVKLVVAAEGVPAGDYTRTVLANLGLTGALDNVVSEESDVRDVLAKVALRAADAGFVYSTDARAVRGKVGVIGIRPSAEPTVAYAVAVVSASAHAATARSYVRRLLGTAAQRRLRAAGFLPPPRG